MAKQDPGRLIEHTQELIRQSEDLCDRSRQSVNKSKQLRKAVALSVSYSRSILRNRKRPKLPLKKSA